MDISLIKLSMCSLIGFKLPTLCLVGGGMSKFQSLRSGKEVSQTFPSVGCKYWK
mgnify:CR=1 FL=1